MRAAAELLGNYRLSLRPIRHAGALRDVRRRDAACAHQPSIFGAADPKTGACGSVVNLFARAAPQPSHQRSRRRAGGRVPARCCRASLPTAASSSAAAGRRPKKTVMMTQRKTLGLVAPSGYMPDPGVVDRAAAFLSTRGWQVEAGDSVFSREQRFAGPDEQRLSDLTRFATDPSIDVVLSSRGGYGLSRLLDRIDFATIRRAEPVIVGFRFHRLQSGLPRAGRWRQLAGSVEPRLRARVARALYARALLRGIAGWAAVGGIRCRGLRRLRRPWRAMRAEPISAWCARCSAQAVRAAQRPCVPRGRQRGPRVRHRTHVAATRAGRRAAPPAGDRARRLLAGSGPGQRQRLRPGAGGGARARGLRHSDRHRPALRSRATQGHVAGGKAARLWVAGGRARLEFPVREARRPATSPIISA